MIFTVTLNPSLDYFLLVKDFKLAQTNRTENEILFPAGKGINVSLMLQQLGFQSQMLGFLAGFSGKEIQRRLQALNAMQDFIFLQTGHSRINIKICSKQESEINAKGPEISKEEIQALFQKIQQVQEQDFLVLSGSLPQGLSSDFYAQLMQQCRSQKIILDCTGEAMQKALECQPFLIKPNRAEIEEMFGLCKASLEDLQECAMMLQKKGAKNVLVSMGAEGAFLLKDDQSLHCCKAPKGEPLNSVGAGDSMVAGMIAALKMGFGFKQAFFYSIACGSASAFSQGFATKEEVESLFKNLIKEEK